MELALDEGLSAIQVGMDLNDTLAHFWARLILCCFPGGSEGEVGDSLENSLYIYAYLLALSPATFYLR